MTKEKTFSIGLTMAGAVSAGAYTAGVMDYLIETLENWEKARKKDEKDVPSDYKVIIEIMSGASAGGITAALAAMSMRQNHTPANDENKRGQNNLLYDCWVNMADDGEQNNTIKKLLDLDDLQEEEGIQSILNSKVMDVIAGKAVEYGVPKTPFPSFISKDLDVVLTVTNLNGLSYNIEFKSYQEATPARLTMHSGLYRFRFREGNETHSDDYFNLNLKDKRHRNIIVDAAKASGAFPIGLRARKEQFLTKFIKQYSQSIFPESHKGNISLDESILQNDTYSFVAVDGGVINNEPYGYTYRNIKEKIENKKEKAVGNYAIIMVNPFPNDSRKSEEDDNKTDIFSILPKLITTLRNQVMFKQEDLLAALSDDDSTRFLIAPIRKAKIKNKRVPVENPIACGALGGFSGFFDKEFRQHDFELGRKNCQDFIRYYFAKRDDEKHFIHENWTDAMKKRFGFYRKDQKGERVLFLPIIPDVNVVEASKQVYKKGWEVPRDFPTFDASRFENIRPLVKKRAKKMVQLLIKSRMKNGFGSGLIYKTFFLGFKWLGPGFLSRKITKRVEDIVKADFEAYELLEKE